MSDMLINSIFISSVAEATPVDLRACYEIAATDSDIAATAGFRCGRNGRNGASVAPRYILALRSGLGLEGSVWAFDGFPYDTSTAQSPFGLQNSSSNEFG